MKVTVCQPKCVREKHFSRVSNIVRSYGVCLDELLRMKIDVLERHVKFAETTKYLYDSFSSTLVQVLVL